MTRAHLANGEHFDYDETVCAHPTHVNDQRVVRLEQLPDAEPAEDDG